MRKNVFAAAMACVTLLCRPAISGDEIPMMTATGSFDVRVLPPLGPAAGDGFVHLSLEKTFQGSLDGTSRVEMMATSDSGSSRGYVALERFTGKLDGRAGSFILQHLGTMSEGSTHLTVVVTPGSGKGELAGLSGTLEIRQEGKQHFYTFRYALQ